MLTFLEPKCGAERGIDNRSQTLQVSKGLTQKTGLDPESALEKQASAKMGWAISGDTDLPVPGGM